jgi:NADH:ubiquinone oxidoreductase subunit 2 (subunit N)
VLFAVVALYYYARIFNQMFMKTEVDAEPIASGFGMRLALGITGLATIAVGMFPNSAISAVNWTIPAAANTVANLIK